MFSSFMSFVTILFVEETFKKSEILFIYYKHLVFKSFHLMIAGNLEITNDEVEC